MHLKILIRENLFYVNLENWDRSTPSNSPKAPTVLYLFKEKEKKGSVTGGSSKSVHFVSTVLAPPQFRERSHEEILHQEGCVRKATGERTRSRFRCINAHDEQKELSSAEMDTLKMS